MSWMNKQVSLYSTHADNAGRAATVRDILLTEFASDLDAIVELRGLDRMAPDFKERKLRLKASLQCFTPAGLLQTKERGKMTEISRSGLLQLDFDQQGIADYDLEEIKRCVFSLPFIAFCGLSCSGEGFYALACIAEPDKLADYAQHIFLTLDDYGIKADTSKGKKVENLRYVSYDANMMIRDDPEVLRITHFRTKPRMNHSPQTPMLPMASNAGGLIKSQLAKIQGAAIGSRWETVQQVAYTLGGVGDPDVLFAIKSEIESCAAFNGEEAKYIKCAEDCFTAGAKRPLSALAKR